MIIGLSSIIDFRTPARRITISRTGAKLSTNCNVKALWLEYLTSGVNQILDDYVIMTTRREVNFSRMM